MAVLTEVRIVIFHSKECRRFMILSVIDTVLCLKSSCSFSLLPEACRNFNFLGRCFDDTTSF